MFTHILVPLDGSVLAEAALPSAVFLATRLNARITLIHIIEAGAPSSIHGERHLSQIEEADSYLREIGARNFPAGVRVDRHVHAAPMKDVADGIVLHEDEIAPDLVIMCSHGHGGLRRMLFGRIAHQVAASGTIPVLLIQPKAGDHQRPFQCRRILAPTEGTALHAKGLAAAADLARALSARLELITVIPTIGDLEGRYGTVSRFAPGTTQAVLRMETDQFQQALLEKAQQFSATGLAVGIRVARGEPASGIVAHADAVDADLIVIGTHGRMGPEGFWAHSIGARLLARTSRPILLVPV